MLHKSNGKKRHARVEHVGTRSIVRYKNGLHGGSKYQPIYAEYGRKFCMLGATDQQLGQFFEVTENTIVRWKREFPEFSLALKEGKSFADANVATSLFRRATGYTCIERKVFFNSEDNQAYTVDVPKHYPPDATSMIFWLKNRQPALWRDRIEHTGAGGAPIKLEALNDQQLEILITRLQKGMVEG